MRYGARITFSYVNSHLFQYPLFKTSLRSLWIGAFDINQMITCGPLLDFLCSIGLFVLNAGTAFSHCSLYSSESWKLVCEFFNFALHQRCFGYLSPRHLHMHFGIGLSVSSETLPGFWEHMCWCCKSVWRAWISGVGAFSLMQAWCQYLISDRGDWVGDVWCISSTLSFILK